jgi:hypothetical protein
LGLSGDFWHSSSAPVGHLTILVAGSKVKAPPTAGATASLELHPTPEASTVIKMANGDAVFPLLLHIITFSFGLVCVVSLTESTSLART